jgi:hypothetical protein
VCAFAILLILLTAGMRLSIAVDSFATDSVPQITAGHGPMAPNKTCPFGNHSQDFGNCSINSLVGFEQQIGDQATRAEPKLSHYVIGPSATLAKIYGSRLERPPRF